MGKGKAIVDGVVRLGSEVADNIMGLVLYSPSLKAAKGLPQAKGSYQQMRSMLLKGGAKEDELAWSGFDKAFSGRKGQITKDEIEQYLAQNTDMVDEVSDTAEGRLSQASTISDSDLVDQYVDANLENEVMYYRDDWLPERLRDEYQQVRDLDGDELAELADRLGVDVEDLDVNQWVVDGDVLDEEDAVLRAFGDPEDMARESLYENARSMRRDELLEYMGAADDVADTSHVQYANYFTPGAEDYTESRYVFTDPAGLLSRDGIGGHWNEDNVVAHARTAFFPTADGRAYHVGEVQSDWAQKARKGEIATPQQEAMITEAKGANEELNAIERQASDAIYGSGLQADQLRRRMFDMYANPTARASAVARGVDPNITSSFVDMNALRFMRETAPPDVPLPLEFNAPDQRMAAEFMAGPGARANELENLVNTAADVDRGTFPGAPYIDSTSKWVDMVLRRNLLEALKAPDTQYMTVGNPEMVRAMTYGTEDGQSAFYGEIVPRRLKEIATKIDKGAQIGPVRISTEEGSQNVLGLRLTPEFRAAAERKGIPYWMLLGGMTGGGLLSMQPNQAQAAPLSPEDEMIQYLKSIEGR